MPINFPNAPVNGEVYTANGSTWTYSTTVGAWLSASTTINPPYVFPGDLKITTSLGVGTDASGITGEIRATNNITAYYSDGRLKTIVSTISNPIDKVKSLSGIIFINNETAALYGYNNKNEQVGVIAQEVEQVLPQIVKLAPFDSEYVDGIEKSKSGKHYKTVQYDKLIPLLIEAIKEQQRQIEALRDEINIIKEKD